MDLNILLGDFPSDSLGNDSQENTFRWATVESISPLAIRLDNSQTALDATPVNLAGVLKVGERVWVQLSGKRLVILGKSYTEESYPRISLESTLTWGSVATEFTLRAIGKFREIRGSLSGSLPEGTTAVTNWWALAEEDRPSRNVFSYAYLGGNNPGAFLARPDGQMALINQSGATRSGNHQFNLMYTVD